VNRERLLALTLVELADTLVADFDVVDLLTKLADRCVEILDVQAAGLMLATKDGQLRLMASSSAVMRGLELFELQSREGPCLDAFRTGETIVNHDLVADDGRWPLFGAAAIAAGFHSVHALPMRLRGTTIGALNMFQTEAGFLRGPDVEAARSFADVATIAILQHRAAIEGQLVNTHLQTVLNGRIMIEQAKGMIAERQQVEPEQAFRILRHHAHSHDMGLTDVANAVITNQLRLDALPDMEA
jgi:transcriptional regulator with GAF, ATPase, and Fis domain